MPGFSPVRNETLCLFPQGIQGGRQTVHPQKPLIAAGSPNRARWVVSVAGKDTPATAKTFLPGSAVRRPGCCEPDSTRFSGSKPTTTG